MPFENSSACISINKAYHRDFYCVRHSLSFVGFSPIRKALFSTNVLVVVLKQLHDFLVLQLFLLAIQLLQLIYGSIIFLFHGQYDCFLPGYLFINGHRSAGHLFCLLLPCQPCISVYLCWPTSSSAFSSIDKALACCRLSP